MLLVKTRVKVSSIHGLGVFAEEFIPKGTIVWKFYPGIDLEFTPEELKKLPESFQEFSQMYTYVPSDSDVVKHILCADHAKHMNHSEEPNLGETADGCNIANQDIQMGEELTCNYLTFDSEFALKMSLK